MILHVEDPSGFFLRYPGSVCVPPLLGVPAGVEGEVVAAREPAAAVGALEGLGAGVLAVVAGELVGAGEPPLAPLP